MKRSLPLVQALVCLAVFVVASRPALAQPRTHSARAAIQSPHALAMGNAVAAFPSTQSVFFYNPAHLVNLPSRRAPIILLGFNATASRAFPDQLSFYSEELRPALAAGLETLEDAERQALYQETTRLGQRFNFAGGDLFLPSFAMQRGRFGFGGGLFATGELRYLAEATERRVPMVDLVTQADFMALAAGALDLSDYGPRGLSVGVAAKVTQRYLVLKNKPLDQLDDDENYYVLGSGALGADVGLHYATPAGVVPGTLHLAAVLYDALGNTFDYQFQGFYDKNTPEADAQTLAAEERLAADRLRLKRSYRLGVAYTTPAGGPFGGSGLALDYFNDPTLIPGDAVTDHLRLGAQLALSQTLAVRAGLKQGMPTVGAGVHLSFITFDYAYYHVQEQGLPPGWTHTMQVTLGSF